LFEELGNVVIVGITTNLKMKGISLSKSEGTIKDNAIKINYIFMISNEMVSKIVIHLSREKNASSFMDLAKNLMDLEHNVIFYFSS
jgi:mRNA interferase MazF